MNITGDQFGDGFGVGLTVGDGVTGTNLFGKNCEIVVIGKEGHGMLGIYVNGGDGCGNGAGDMSTINMVIIITGHSIGNGCPINK